MKLGRLKEIIKKAHLWLQELITKSNNHGLFWLFYFYCFMMKLIAWSIRGLANNPSIRRLKRLIKVQNILCSANVEPRVTKGSIKDYEFKLNCMGSISNHEGNIWVFLEVWY